MAFLLSERIREVINAAQGRLQEATDSARARAATGVISSSRVVSMAKLVKAIPDAHRTGWKFGPDTPKLRHTPDKGKSGEAPLKGGKRASKLPASVAVSPAVGGLPNPDLRCAFNTGCQLVNAVRASRCGGAQAA